MKILLIVSLLTGLNTRVSAAKPFAMRVFANYQSAQVYRGALIWPEGSGLAGPGLVFFEKVFIFTPIFSLPQQKEGTAFSGEVDFHLLIMSV